MQESAVIAALELLRPSLASDGFNLRLGSIKDDVVRLVLEAKPEACLDCLVPEDVMINILEDAIRNNGAPLSHVEIERSGFDSVVEH